MSAARGFVIGVPLGLALWAAILAAGHAQISGTRPVAIASDGAPAVSAAQAAALQPSACPAPATDTLNGSAGSAATCVPRQDASRPTAVQRAIVTTDATGSWSLTWAKAFGATPALSMKPIMAGSTKGDCGVSTVSTTAASGTCWTYQSTVVSILGATVSPIATAAAGVQVMIVGGVPTQ